VNRLVIALSTVKTHINNIYRKLGVRNRAEAIMRALDLCLV
jgi:ATP/maltotriose-dependent transcriptional regulator MalT